jgi:hypothetical protein
MKEWNLCRRTLSSALGERSRQQKQNETFNLSPNIIFISGSMESQAEAQQKRNTPFNLKKKMIIIIGSTESSTSAFLNSIFSEPKFFLNNSKCPEEKFIFRGKWLSYSSPKLKFLLSAYRITDTGSGTIGKRKSCLRLVHSNIKCRPIRKR